MKNEVMTFRGKYAFLSNMYEVNFEWDGRRYHNSEAAFQSAKSLDASQRDLFSDMNGVTAKRAGKKVQLRPDWERVKDNIMEEVVRAKFSQNPQLAKMLIDTGDMELQEGNRWHDTYWGVDVVSGKGENHLGIILMKIRAELGGEAYRESVAQIRKEKELEKQSVRDAIQAQMDEIQAEMEAFPDCEFVGRKWKTKAFGIVTILRREGDYLYFEAGGVERQFLLPGCIAQGFLVPEEAELVAQFQTMQMLQSKKKELQKALDKLS